MEELKRSTYSYMVPRPIKGVVLLFNFYTLRLIALRPADARPIRDLLTTPNVVPTAQHARLREMLAEHGFLIRADIDELDLLRAARWRAATQHHQLGLTILPSLACNFQCTYCYESKGGRSMTPEVEAALCRLVVARLRPGGRLSVHWFGGEPLLDMDIIERLSEEFARICQETDATYSASMVTNGYLLDRLTAQKLSALGVKSVQVTLDGPPEIHDARRPTRRGEPTFRRIVDNLKACWDVFPIDVRMNVDQTNMQTIGTLLDILIAEGLQQRIGLYPGQTYPYTAVCSDVAGYCLGDEEFALLKLEMTMEMVRRSFASRFGLPMSRNVCCLADSANSFVVTPTGGICNCWNEADNPDAEIGHLLEPLSDRMRANQASWQCRDPFALECTECLLLPICMGGCPYIYKISGKLSCHPWKHHLDESITLYYYLQKLKQEATIARQLADVLRAGAEQRQVPD